MNKNVKNLTTHEGKKILLNRFNRSTEESSYLEDFQEIMKERLLLSHYRKYNKKDVDRIIWRVTNRNPRMINTDIGDGFLLSCNVEADFYILLQEKLKQLTGKHWPMDEFIMLLLSWFYTTYKDKKIINKKLPLKQSNNYRKKIYLKNKFHNKFKKYYKNII